MFKFVSIASLILAVAYAANYNELDNFIEYGDRSLNNYIPYAYQPPRPERLVKKISPYLDDGHGNLLVPAGHTTMHTTEVTDVATSKFGYLSTIVFYAYKFIKKAITFVMVTLPALITGSFVALGVCQVTPFCGNLSIMESLAAIQEKVSSLATPDHLASATEFVQNAVKKYTSLQKTE